MVYKSIFCLGTTTKHTIQKILFCLIILSIIGFPISTHAAERGFIESVYCKVISFFKLSCDNEDTVLTINTESDTDVTFSSSSAPHSDEDVFDNVGSPTQTLTDTSFSGSSPVISTYPLSPSVHTSYATVAYLDRSLMLLRSELLNSKNPISHVSGSPVSSERLSKQVDSIYDSVSKSISTLRDETNLNLASVTTALQSELQAITANITGGALFNGGNAFGAPLTMGTTDTQALSLITGGTERLTVLANGNVGIGTSTPSSKFTVDGNADFESISLSGMSFVTTYGDETSSYIGGGAGNSSAVTSNNVGVGYLSLSSLSTGLSNTSLGSRALQDVTTGNNNVAIGQGTLRYITDSSNNVAIGRQSSNGLLSGSLNVTIGANAMQSTQVATGIVAIGQSTLFQSTDAGSNSTFVGSSSGRGISGGQENTFLGATSGGNSTKTGSYNTMLGSRSGINLGTGSNNISIGYNINLPSGNANNQLNIGNLIYGTGLDGTLSTVSTGNIGIGTTTPLARLSVKGAGTTTGLLAQFSDSADTPRVTVLDNGNVGIGTVSPNLVAYSIGSKVLTIKSTGTNRASVIELATDHILSGNTVGEINFIQESFGVLDTKIQAYRSGANGQLNLGFVAGGSERLTVMRNGNIGIGTTTPSEKLSVAGNARFTTVTSGAYAFDLNLTVDGVLTTSASDERLKRDITRLDSKDTLDRMMMLEPSSFIWKEGGTHDFGLIAQEVEIVFPELVFTNGADGFKGINYSRLPALLISAVQELAIQIKNLATRVETKELCIGKTCVNEAQLLELLEMKANQTSGGTAPTQSSSTESTPQFQQAEQAESNQSEESDVTEEVYDNTDVNQTQNVSMDDIDGETSTQVDVVTETEPEAQEASAREDSADTIQIQGSDSE